MIPTKSTRPIGIRPSFAAGMGCFWFIPAVFYGFASGEDYFQLITTSFALHFLSSACLLYSAIKPGSVPRRVLSAVLLVFNLFLMAVLIDRLGR